MAVFNTNSEQETADIATQIARTATAGDVFLLEGPMGAGKSIFARAFIRTLCGADTEVPSPTFTLVQTYDVNDKSIWHFDLYRLESPEEIFEIGWEDAMTADVISLIEWPQKAGRYLPQKSRHITINVTSDTGRRIDIND